MYRAWLRGVEVSPAQWAALSTHSRRYFAKPGIRFADFHMCLSLAMAGLVIQIQMIFEIV
jgi:hypothetical protein